VAREFKAAYPSTARSQGIEGVVELRVEIWEDGTVRSATVVRSLGYGLDEAAVGAMRRFLFKPATVDGKAVQYVISKYSFRFELDS
jgi:protein TonB